MQRFSANEIAYKNNLIRRRLVIDPICTILSSSYFIVILIYLTISHLTFLIKFVVVEGSSSNGVSLNSACISSSHYAK